MKLRYLLLIIGLLTGEAINALESAPFNNIEVGNKALSFKAPDKDSISPFMGIELGYSRLNVKDECHDIKNMHPTLAVNYGVLFNQYLGLEVGGHITKKKAKGDNKVDSRSLHAGFNLYMPILEYTHLVAGVGLGHITTYIQNGYVVKLQKVAPRIMFGPEFELTENLGLRLNTVWMPSFKKGQTKHEQTHIYKLAMVWYY